MLECVINVSEGRDDAVLGALAGGLGSALLDLHRDRFHNRSVFTFARSTPSDLVEVAVALTARALELVDLTQHRGVHPRLGVVDVVPFVPLGSAGFGGPIVLDEALAARDTFAELVASNLQLPCFRYGPERSLPEIRRRAFVDLDPDDGPGRPDPRHGACCVGARPCLVAYNLVLEQHDLALARRLASVLRGNEVRALGLSIGEEVQVSCNLIAPWSTGPLAIYEAVTTHTPIARAELVGLIPQALLLATPRRRWRQLGLSEEATIEARLAVAPWLHRTVLRQRT